MTGEDWLLALHLLSAVLLGAALTGFWALTLARSLGPEGVRLLNIPLTVAVSVGSLGTLVFGVWLAILDDAYHVWDGWIVAAIVLWAIGTGLGQRAGTAFAEDAPNARTRGLVLQAVSTIAVAAVLVLMIWKPGA